MKTTLNISDPVMRDLRREAQRSGRTMSELVETALRSMLAARRPREAPPPLPVFSGGKPRVDVANREALYGVMESR